MKEEIIITKANGEQEVFDAEKLRGSLLKAGTAENIADSIIQHIENELTDGMSTREIYKHAFSLLDEHDRPVAANYSLRRAVMDLGPSGFPFEKLIAAIFNENKYETETGRHLQGKCIDHEVDVIAYDENNLHIIEAKFHNQVGVKTDSKVALYVKARFDDLREVDISVGGKNRKMTEGWLITNTKFTKSAVDYGKCQNIKLVGWNYPSVGSLHDMIRKSGLHPLTSLTSISKAEEKILLERDIVLLRHIKADPDSLNILGVAQDKKNSILDEVNLILGH